MHAHRNPRRPKVQLTCDTCGTVFMRCACHLKGAVKHYCSPECRLRRKLPAVLTKDNLIQCANVDPATGCWNWKYATVLGDGVHRGRIKVDGKTWVASRYSWTLFFGPIPEGQLVCHTCDNGLCINPEHFFLGTTTDNSLDCVSKGRHCHGEQSHLAKLTDENVRDILASYSRGERQQHIADRYHIGQANVSRIITGVMWKHVPRIKEPPAPFGADGLFGKLY